MCTTTRKGLEPMPSSTRILFGEWTAGVGERDRESLLLEASAVANVEQCDKVLSVPSLAIAVPMLESGAQRRSACVGTAGRLGMDVSLSVLKFFLEGCYSL